MTSGASLPVSFAVTPRFDIFYALYTLANSATSSLDPWKSRASSRLPEDFETTARRVAPLPIFWPLLADSLQDADGEISFDEIIANLRGMSPQKLQKNILAGIIHEESAVRALVSGKRTVRQLLAKKHAGGTDLLTYFGLRPYDRDSHSAKTISTLLSSPESFRNNLALVLEQFWETGFRRDWLALEPVLREESLRMRDAAHEHSLEKLARDLKLPASFDETARELRSKTGAPIPYDQIDGCWIIPSAFNSRRWWAKYVGKSARARLYFPVMSGAASANGIAADRRPAKPGASTGAGYADSRVPIDAESVFRALGDTTRYAIASLLARTPTTSAELARSLNVSKPTITHHVQALRSAGLISETPAGGSTKLSLNRAAVGAISEAAVNQLFSSTADLNLATTRKRRNS
jgi:DNA-binding transcriptional ArsR family regulator